MSKAIVFFGPQGIALKPAILCAENPAEARQYRLPLLEQVLARISDGMELRRNLESAYELYEKGRFVGTIEVQESPLDGAESPSLDGLDRVES